MATLTDEELDQATLVLRERPDLIDTLSDLQERFERIAETSEECWALAWATAVAAQSLRTAVAQAEAIRGASTEAVEGPTHVPDTQRQQPERWTKRKDGTRREARIDAK